MLFVFQERYWKVFDNKIILSWNEKNIDLFLLESVLCKWSLIALCWVRIVSTLQLSFMLSHFIAQYAQSQIRKSFKLFLWFIYVCWSLWFTWLTLQNTVAMSPQKSCDLHKVIHCALRASVILKQKRFETELLIHLQCLLSNILIWVFGSRTLLPDFVT